MTDNEIAYLAKYCSPHSILVVTWQGKLKVLHTPFRLRVLQNVGGLIRKSIQYAEKVKVSRSGKMVYIVNGKPYLYSYFDILTG